ncbi:MAG: hypothetical protein A3F18_02115 [Legionellales bacterium RIFCSPHIGHO2_12_FULL_37_14]|nr:MAG: hypothetical protein A3F18_02115 [Legionellales bacterium RIFCSPHIGHO2_12_FULL_37_14]
MKKIFIVLVAILFSLSLANACTSFGMITNDGTIIGKNRDFYYGPQHVGVFTPKPRFFKAFLNKYSHKNLFYALEYKDGISMGVNQHGLTAIQEDFTPPHKPAKQRRFKEPLNGLRDSNLLYAVLQNFNSIEEMIPYINNIFKKSAPGFYQFADAHKILTVEVAFAANNKAPNRQFTYNILSKKGEYFTHTNSYLSPKFTHLNQGDQQNFISSNNRLKTITNLISNTKNVTIKNASAWFSLTRSNVSEKNKNGSCFNSSIFRSYIKGAKSVNLKQQSTKIYGTMSSMIVHNNKDLATSKLYLKLISGISTDQFGRQHIKYQSLYTNLKDLFSAKKLIFNNHKFTRMPPKNGVCT